MEVECVMDILLLTLAILTQIGMAIIGTAFLP